MAPSWLLLVSGSGDKSYTWLWTHTKMLRHSQQNPKFIEYKSSCMCTPSLTRTVSTCSELQAAELTHLLWNNNLDVNRDNAYFQISIHNCSFTIHNFLTFKRFKMNYLWKNCLHIISQSKGIKYCIFLSFLCKINESLFTCEVGSM